MYRFEKLEVWQKALDLCKIVYRISKSFPKSETYGLTAQLRRSVTSILLNIAEGSACGTKKEFVQFLTIALRSHYETITIVKLAFSLEFLNKTNYEFLEQKLAELGRLLQGLINSLKRNPKINNQKPKTD